MREFRLDVTLHFKSPICVASTASPLKVGVDKVTSVNSAKKPYIPASTLKGRARAKCEMLLRSLGAEVCLSPLPETMCPHFFLSQGKGEMFCPVCEIFGSPWRHSPVRFEDAQLIAAEGEEAPLLPRYGVSLDRKQGTAVRGRLFLFEASPPRAFSFGVEGRLPSNYHLAALVASILSLDFVGGGKSRGLGWIEEVKVSLDGKPLEGKEREELLSLLLTEAPQGGEEG